MDNMFNRVSILVLLISFVNLSLGEEITFHNHDGSSLQWTINSGRCYNIRGFYNKRAIKIDIDSGCFSIFKSKECEGEKKSLTKGSHTLQPFGFHRAVSSVRLCSLEEESKLRSRRSIFSFGSKLWRREGFDNVTMQAVRRDYTINELREVAVTEHNKYRRMHGVPDVKGNQQMHEDSQRWVDELVRTNMFKATTMGKYGSNIASSFKDDKIEAIRDVIKTWYEKGKSYNYAGEGLDADDKKTGSFTAIVWKATTEIGMGIAWSDAERQYFVNCFYYPPVQRGQYKENVLPPK